MPFSFVCDVHIPPRLTAWLRAEGYEAIHVYDVGFGDKSDIAIWDYAIARAAIVITKDHDFVRLAVTRPEGRAVIVRTGNCSNHVLLAKFESLLPMILNHFVDGKQIVELR